MLWPSFFVPPKPAPCLKSKRDMNAIIQLRKRRKNAGFSDRKRVRKVFFCLIARQSPEISNFRFEFPPN